MKTIYLSSTEVTAPDFGGFNFFVEHGREFDVDAYAEAYGLAGSDIDQDTVKGVHDAVARLNRGNWLLVSHEAA